MRSLNCAALITEMTFYLADTITRKVTACNMSCYEYFILVRLYNGSHLSKTDGCDFSVTQTSLLGWFSVHITATSLDVV